MGYLGPSLRRTKRVERPLRRVAVAAVASLALNAAIFLGLGALGAFQVPGAARQTRVAMAPLSAAQWDANRAVSRPPGAVAPPAAQPPPRPEDRLDGHVVELSPSQKASEKPPPKSRFLTDRNTQVEKETVSRFAGNYPRLAPKPEAGSDGKVLPQLGESGERGRPGQSGPDLSVSPEALARIAGGPNMDGAHEGLPEGDETGLNAREFKYATFMNRMRAGIAAHWYPAVRDATKTRDPNGSIYFYRERTVVLALVLDPTGNVKDLSVKQSSNVE